MERVARVSEIIGASPISFDDAIRVGFERVSKTLRAIS
ncbi:MAG: dodecin family protein, partial [Proteobacteria bacterium]|nr:dodecin family protein [Pseudomonadota bacterium]